MAPPAWAPERFDAGAFAALAAVTQERVTVLGEVPELVDFLFLEDAPGRPGQLAEGDRRRRAARRGSWPTRWRPTRRADVGQGRAARGHAGHRRGGGAQAGQGAGADPGGRHGPDARACRCSTRWRCSAASETCRRLAAALDRRDACPLMLLAPLRWALRIAILVVTVIVLYFAVTLVQVWLTSRQYDPHPAGAILVMGAAQYDCVPSPDLRGPPGPGGDPLPPGLRPA